MVKSQKKKACQLWKSTQIAISNCKDLRTCRDAVRKAEDQLELSWPMMSRTRMGSRYISSKQKHREDIHRPVTKQGREAS